MSFGERLRSVRIAQNLSQTELSEMAGISERSIYSYEQTGIFPRPNVMKRLAAALNINAQYLLGEEENEKADIDQDLFLAKVKEGFGYKGAREAKEVFTRAAALFAGGDLDDKAKDTFFQSLMEVYLESKKEAREKFSPRQRVSRKKQVPTAS